MGKVTDPVAQWRARALVNNGDGEWRGRWRRYEGARSQAQRWCDTQACVWLECRDGVGLTILEWDPRLGKPEPYHPVTNA